jgi:hypothetical protein
VAAVGEGVRVDSEGVCTDKEGVAPIVKVIAADSEGCRRRQ